MCRFCFLGFIAGFPSRILAQVISSTLINGQYACQDSEINFTCMTRGSPGITWISDKFIGRGGSELGFSAEIDDPKQKYSSIFIPTTVATLMKEYDDNGVLVLESMLRIIATAGSLTPSVTCRDERTGTPATVNFQILRKGHYLITRMAILTHYIPACGCASCNQCYRQYHSCSNL